MFIGAEEINYSNKHCVRHLLGFHSKPLCTHFALQAGDVPSLPSSFMTTQNLSDLCPLNLHLFQERNREKTSLIAGLQYLEPRFTLYLLTAFPPWFSINCSRLEIAACRLTQSKSSPRPSKTILSGSVIAEGFEQTASREEKEKPLNWLLQSAIFLPGYQHYCSALRRSCPQYSGLLPDRVSTFDFTFLSGNKGISQD